MAMLEFVKEVNEEEVETVVHRDSPVTDRQADRHGISFCKERQVAVPSLRENQSLSLP